MLPAQEPSDDIIERVVKAHENDEFLAGSQKDAPIAPIYKFYAYKLRIEEILNILMYDKKPRTFPIDDLILYETDLDEITGKLHDLYKPLRLKNTEHLQNSINEAGTLLSVAIEFRKKDNMAEYLRNFKGCRDQLFYLLGFLEAAFLELKTSLKNNEAKS